MENEDKNKKIAEESARQAEIDGLSPITFDELEDQVAKRILMKDDGIIAVTCAMYVQNLFPRKAVWMFLIGPSSGGKTLFLDAMADLPKVRQLSTLTPNTFISGMAGRAASLLPKLTGCLVIFKDWTSILSMRWEARSEIVGQLREIWDGRISKAFGTGQQVTWEGKISILAASTQAIDLAQQQLTVLGERFLNYRLEMPDEIETALLGLENDAEHPEMMKDIRNLYCSYFKGLVIPTELPKLSLEIKQRIVNLANFVVKARSGVIRDTGMKKDVIFVPASERPVRLSQQLQTLGQALVVVLGENQIDRAMEILYKVALDSIPSTNCMVISVMAKSDGQTTKQIATALGYPTTAIHFFLENLTLLKVSTRMESRGKGDTWTIKPEFGELFRHYTGVEQIALAIEIVPALNEPGESNLEDWALENAPPVVQENLL